MYKNVHAIVLSSERVFEKDKRLSLFTREKGRLFAVAKGAARPGARLGPATESGVESCFRLWMETDSPFARVTGGAVVTSFPNVRKEWTRMSTAHYFCEWMGQLTALLHPHPEKYELLHRALGALETADVTCTRMAFLIQFLEKAGYRVEKDVFGSGYDIQWRFWVENLKSWNFDPGFYLPGLKNSACHLEEQLLKFVTPLLARPLKALVHEKKLHHYRKTVIGYR